MEKNETSKIGAKEAKRWLRSLLIRRRQQQAAREQSSHSQKIIRHLIQSSVFKKAAVIATYIGFASEVLTDGLIEEGWRGGKKILVPMTLRGFDQPAFVLFQKGDALKRTSFGPLELVMPKKPFPFKTVDLVLVPGLGFDAEGNRLGYGGGVYDRLLQKTPRAHHMGLFFSFQQLHKIPRETHDLRLSSLCTESGIQRIK